MAKQTINWKDQGVNLNADKLSGSMATNHARLRELFEETKAVKDVLETEIGAWLRSNAAKLPVGAQERFGIVKGKFPAGHVFKFGYRGGIIVASVPGSKARSAADAIEVA